MKNQPKVTTPNRNHRQHKTVLLFAQANDLTIKQMIITSFPRIQDLQIPEDSQVMLLEHNAFGMDHTSGRYCWGRFSKA